MKWIFAIICLLLIIPVVSADPTNWTYTTPGTYTWTCPANVTEVIVQIAGGGGSGRGCFNNYGYVRRGLGGYAADWQSYSSVTVFPGVNYTIVVGSGGAADAPTGSASLGNAGGLSSAFGYSIDGGLGAGGDYSVGGNGGDGNGEGGFNLSLFASNGMNGTAGTGGNATLGYGGAGGGAGADAAGLAWGGAGANGTVRLYLPGYAPGNIPDFSATPLTGISGTMVKFTDESTIIDASSLAYNWSFGDGEYSDVIGDVIHVYPYLGSFDVSLTITNGADITTETKISYVNIINKEGTTVFYSPKQSVFKVVDKNNNPVVGANVTANFNQSTLPTTELNWLVSNYGMNIQAANEALNGTLVMSGITDSTGAIAFTMQSTLGYDVNVVSGGSTYHFMVNSHDNYYILRITSGGYTSPQDVNNTYSGISNSTLTFSEPNSSYMTMGVDYLDSTGNTDNLIFTIKLVNNNTVMYTTSQAITGATRVLINKTYPNVRGERWIWYYDAHRTV